MLPFSNWGSPGAPTRWTASSGARALALLATFAALGTVPSLLRLMSGAGKGCGSSPWAAVTALLLDFRRR